MRDWRPWRSLRSSRGSIWSGSQVTDAGVLRIATYCPALQLLSLEHTRITDACLEILDQLPALEYLRVTDTAVTNEAIERIAKTHPVVEVDKMEP